MSARVGEPAPHFAQSPVFGLTVDTASLAARGGLALVFLRHAGSALTRRTATDLERIHEDLELADVALVAVVRGSQRSARDLVPRLRLVFPVVHDAEGALYEAWGVGRSWRGLARDPGALRLLRALGAGQGRPEGPLDQLPAAFAVDRGGIVRWRWVGESPTALLDVAALRVAALSAQQGGDVGA